MVCRMPRCGPRNGRANGRQNGVGGAEGVARFAGCGRRRARDRRDMADKAPSLAQQASTRVYNALPDREDRDTYLLGAAALAVAAAVGIAYQRRVPHEDIAQR